MTTRNLSPQTMFMQMAAEHKPEAAFVEGSDFKSWRAQTLPRVLSTLGDFPRRVEPNPELLLEWGHDGLKKQRWIIDVGPHIAATFQINYPSDIRAGEKRPTLMCWHGHNGGVGKDPVMGNDSTDVLAKLIKDNNYNYGHQMAKHGFVTFAIDWIGMGDRSDITKPNHHRPLGRDWCDNYYLHATMFGMTSLSINLAHGQAATDFACTLPGVDADRLGIMGLSGGGTMTVWCGLFDQRFKAMEVMCYSDLFADFGVRDSNYCGMQVAPGLYKLVDVPDLQGLLAPRPLLVDIAVHDDCFLVDSAMRCFKGVEKIYNAGGAGDNLELDLFAGGHAWGANKSLAFFRKHLGA